MNRYNELYILTGTLLTMIERMETRFVEIKESKADADFFAEVKPFSKEVKNIIDQWKKEALDWLYKETPKNFHPKQIETASENIEIISIQAFFSTTSRKRFIDHIQSVRYLLTGILAELNKSE